MELTADLITQIGFPVAIAGFLVWYMATNLSKQIDTLAQRINQNTKTVAYLAVVLAKANGLDPDELKNYISQDGGNNG